VRDICAAAGAPQGSFTNHFPSKEAFAVEVLDQYFEYLKGLVRDALDTLGDPCREIIELKYFGDLSYEEIAGELQMNPKTVSSRLSKCLDKLEEITRKLFREEKVSPYPV